MTGLPQQARPPVRFDPAARHDVRVDDVEYARRDGEPLLARVDRPAAPGPWPALVDVHGGAWCLFDRTADAYVDRALAASGMVVVALDFRQGAQPFPRSVCDVLSGVRFVRAHAASLDAAPEPIGITGGSSGGHLALLAAICPDDPFFDPARLRQGHESHFGDEATMLRASIPRILRARAFRKLPPVWIAHPEHDRNVTLAMSASLAGAYRDAGGDAALELFAGVGHAFANFPGPAADRCVERMRSVIAARLAAGEVAPAAP